MQILEERIEGVSVLSFAGQFDHRAHLDVRDRLRSRVPAETPRVLVDLGELEALDSGGLAVLVAFGRELGSRGGCLKLCAPRPGVDTVLKLSRIDRAFETFLDRASALKSFGF